MTYSRDLLVAELERDEGIRGDLYDDATGKTLKPGMTLVGNPTVGCGHNMLANPLSQPDIDRFLENDIASACLDLDHTFPWWRSLDDVRQRVLINMTFNMGVAGLLTFHDTLAAIKAGHWADAAAWMRLSLWAQQVGARAERLAHMMETGSV